MTKKIRSALRRQAVSAGKCIVLIAVCIAAGAVIVWPLWRFATSAPGPYTITVVFIFSAFILYRIIRAVRASSWKSTLRVVLHTILVAGGLYASAAFVFSGHRFAAVPVILLVPVLYVLISHFLSRP
jgi:hypothetical protein